MTVWGGALAPENIFKIDIFVEHKRHISKKKTSTCLSFFLWNGFQSVVFGLSHQGLCEAQAENELYKSECGNDDVRECSD